MKALITVVVEVKDFVVEAAENCLGDLLECGDNWTDGAVSDTLGFVEDLVYDMVPDEWTIKPGVLYKSLIIAIKNSLKITMTIEAFLYFVDNFMYNLFISHLSDLLRVLPIFVRLMLTVLMMGSVAKIS